MIISFDIMNENDFKKIFIDPPISTVHGRHAIWFKNCSHFSFRGMFGGSGALSVSGGITLVYIFGATLPSWRWVCIFCGAVPVIVIFLMPILPETPNWLILQGKRDEAFKVSQLILEKWFFVGSTSTSVMTEFKIFRDLYLFQD